VQFAAPGLASPVARASAWVPSVLVTIERDMLKRIDACAKKAGLC
jgi:hypothetical protein